MPIPALPLTTALAQRLDAHPLLLFLDIDGTIAAVAPRPGEAFVPSATQNVLAELTALPETYVIAISGRGAADARRVVGVDGVWVVGNHGVEVAEPSSEPVARADVVAFADRIASAVAQCETIAAATPGLIVENKIWSMSVHYRLAESQIVPALSREVAQVARELGLRLTYGRKVLELRAPIDVDKGTAALDVARRLGALHPKATLLCAGDDRTDEDAFRALRTARAQSVTIRVGSASASQRETTAEFELPDVRAVREILEIILARRGAAVR